MVKKISRVPAPSLAITGPAVLFLLCLMVSTGLRNRIYYDPLSMWADGVIKSPDKKRTHENYGQSLSTAGNYKEALRQFNIVLSMKESDGSVPMRDVYRELGVVYYRIGQFDDAITAWQKGLRYAPYDVGLLNNLSVTYFTKQSLDEAEAYAKEALRSDPYFPNCLNTLGEIYVKKGRDAEALPYFLKAIEREPNVPGRYWNAAMSLARLGRYDEAYQYASRFLAMARDGRERYQAMELVSQLQVKMRK